MAGMLQAKCSVPNDDVSIMYKHPPNKCPHPSDSALFSSGADVNESGGDKAKFVENEKRTSKRTLAERRWDGVSAFGGQMTPWDISGVGGF